KQSPLLETFEDLVKEFEATFNDLDWYEAALIDQFQSGLHNNVKDLLLTVKDPTSLNDAISKAVQLAPFKEDPMQINTIRIKLLLVAEKRRHHTNNLCFYCGDQITLLKTALENPTYHQELIILSPQKNRWEKNSPSCTALTPELYIHLSDGSQTSVQALIDSGLQHVSWILL
ncbi:16983_t:CDS:2, partial [Dentiscutata heterogama]